jgi:hypothetical protein
MMGFGITCAHASTEDLIDILKIVMVISDSQLHDFLHQAEQFSHQVVLNAVLHHCHAEFLSLFPVFAKCVHSTE